MRDPDPGIMRRARIGLLGMPVGELRNLDPLATACAADGRWSFLLIVAPLSVAGRRWLPARCHNSHTDSELVFLCSSGCSPILADQALDDVGALDPGGHIDRLAGRRRALEHVMHRALALRVLGDAPQRIRVLVVRYPVEVSFPSPPPTHAADRRSDPPPRAALSLHPVVWERECQPRRLLSG
jgi:hypothetical protein